MNAPLKEPGALARAYASHGHMVLRRARALLADEEEARDVVQEVFAGLVQHPEEFGGRSAVSTFLYAATTNLALRRIRDRANRARLVALFVEPQRKDDHSGPMGEHLAVLRDVLARVPHDLAAVATYVYLDELTHDEIAGLLGCSRRTVGNLLERFHDKVRSLLRQDGGDPAGIEIDDGDDTRNGDAR
jgi:RNA polymerase sigma-70 factor (ECF subfamily)